MKFYDLMTLALQNLSRRKMRTILTMIGVVAGTGMLVFMVSLGLGAQQSIQEMLEGMGDLTIIEIYNYGGGANQAVLDDKAMAQPGHGRRIGGYPLLQRQCRPAHGLGQAGPLPDEYV